MEVYYWGMWMEEMEEEREASLEKSEFWRERRGGGLEDEKEAWEDEAGAREGAASSSEEVPSAEKT